MAEPVQQRTVSVRSPWFGVALVGGALVAYATTMRTSFQGDDYEGILFVARRGPGSSWITGLGTGGHLRPVVWSSLWIDHQLFGLHPLGWHLTNVLLHAVVAWLVALLADALVAASPSAAVRSWVGPAAGAIFLLSPSHAEPVSWVAGRGDLLMTALLVISTLAWLRWRSGRRSYLLISLGAFGLALVTKETAVGLPAIFVLLEVWSPPAGGWTRLSVRAAALRVAPAVGLLAAYLATYALRASGGLSEHSQVPPGAGPTVFVRRVGQVVARSAVPAMPGLAWVIVAVLVLACATWLLARRAAVRAAVSVVDRRTLGFVVTAHLSLALLVGPYGVSPFTTAGGRFAYAPSVFTAMALALVLSLVAARSRRVALGVLASIVVVSMATLFVANGTYVRGGRMMEGVVRSQGAWPRDRPIVALVVPDTIEGSWGGRDALGSSLVLVHGWRAPAAYAEVSAVQMQRWDDSVSVRRESCARCIVLHLDAPKARFVWPPAADVPVRAGGTDTTVTRVGDHDLAVRIDADADLSRYWYVSGGRYVRLPPLASLPR